MKGKEPLQRQKIRSSGKCRSVFGDQIPLWWKKIVHKHVFIHYVFSFRHSVSPCACTRLMFMSSTLVSLFSFCLSAFVERGFKAATQSRGLS